MSAPEQPLVGGMGVGVKQRHRDRLRAGAGDLLHERSRQGGIERAQRAAGAGALGRREAELRAHERSAVPERHSSIQARRAPGGRARSRR